jgi:hypothetical protein
MLTILSVRYPLFEPTIELSSEEAAAQAAEDNEEMQIGDTDSLGINLDSAGALSIDVRSCLYLFNLRCCSIHTALVT